MTSKRSTIEMLEMLKESRDDSALVYDYTKFIYTGNEERSVFICKEHGEFNQLFKAHTRNGECPSCKINERRKTGLRNFIKANKEKRKDCGSTYDYSKVKYMDNATPVEIVCDSHGSFWQTPNNHSTKNANCPCCAKEIYRETSIDNWGVEHPMKSKKIQDKLKQVFVKKYGVDNPAKSDNVKVKISEALRQVSSCENEDFKRYYYRVMYRTKQSAKKVPNIEKRNHQTYHLDHRYSVVEGFRNNVPAEIIGSVVNLEIIPAKDNLTKGSACSVSKEELIYEFDKYIKHIG